VHQSLLRETIVLSLCFLCVAGCYNPNTVVANSSLDDELGDDEYGDFEEFYLDNYNDSLSEEESEPLAEYSIEADLNLVELENTMPDNDDMFREIWRDTKRILPERWLKNAFSEFHINSDGEEGTLAYVQADEYQEGRWIIAFDDLDYTGINDKEFIHTVIHEFGHVVFLGEDQLDAEFAEPCNTYRVEEGCSKSNSHINHFYQTFWTTLIDENLAADGDEDELLAFYEKYPNQFISEYAATDPVEDAAEVFTHFVLREKPNLANTVINEKILFMHTQAPLAALRTELRAKLSRIRQDAPRGG